MKTTMDIEYWFTFAGLIGVALTLSVSNVSRQAAIYLQGFDKIYNPLKWIGHGMTDSLHSGFWMGFWWGAYEGANPIVRGGMVAAGAFVADLLLALIDSGVRRLMMGYMVAPQSAAQGVLKRFAPPKPQVVEKEVQRGPRPLTEDEAHAVMDGYE